MVRICRRQFQTLFRDGLVCCAASTVGCGNTTVPDRSENASHQAAEQAAAGEEARAPQPGDQESAGSPLSAGELANSEVAGTEDHSEVAGTEDHSGDPTTHSSGFFRALGRKP